MRTFDDNLTWIRDIPPRIEGTRAQFHGLRAAQLLEFKG
jgi:hypothetical protein